MPASTLALLFLLFLVVSAVFSMFGQGGGAFYVPMLLALSVPIYVAATTSQALIMVVSLSSLLVFARARTVDWKLVLLIEPPTNVGAFLGGYLSPYIPAGIAKVCFAGVLLVGAYYMVLLLRIAGERHDRAHWWLWHRIGVADPYTINVLVLIPMMLSAGFIAGMLGVGGGLIKVPAIVVLGGVPMSIAVGSSSLMIGVTALTGFAGHYMRGHFDPILTAALAGGVLIGSQIGARFAIRANPAKLKKYFAVLLAVISIWLIYGVWR